MDTNNNRVEDTEFDFLTPENVEQELEKLKLIEETYQSDDETLVKILTIVIL